MADNINDSDIPRELTKSESCVFKFQWKIEDFLNSICENGEWLQSKDFGGPTSQPGVNWKINAEINPKGVNDDSRDCVSVFLVIEVKPPEAVTRISANCIFSIMSGDEKKFSLEVTNRLGSSAAKWDWGKIKFKKLIELENRYLELLPNGDLTIQFEGKARALIDPAFSQVWISKEPTAEQKGVVDIVKKLFVDGIGSDVVIKARDGEFKGHKWVLSYRCKYFRGIFDCVLTEGQEGVVDFSEDMNKEELKDLMEFLYLGVASNLARTSRVLLVMAENLGLQELKSLCEEMLIEQLEPDNAWELLNLGHKQNAKNLEKKAVFLLLNEINRNKATYH